MISPYHTTHPSRPALARKQTTERGTSAEQGMIQADSPSDNQDGKGKARARINMACIHCRHRKIRCDGAQPSCATCVRLHRECEYEPVTEYENLISRERKRRNKEKKAARMASHGIFAGQSPLSMLHPGASLGLPPAPLAHYVDLPQQNMAPLFLSIPDSRLEGQGVESQIRPRRRRGISDIPAVHLQHRLGPLASPLPPSSFQHASVSQPSTPAQAYRYYPALAFSPAQQHVAPNVPAELFSGPLSAPLIPPSNSSPFFAAPLPAPSQSQQQQMMASPHVIDLIGLSSASSLPALPSSSASATEADFNYGMIDLTGIPTAIPTSAHVRPVDLPAPHGHFDFASVPFPTQDTFAAELPISALRRRSSIHLPVGTAHAFRRPSVAEVATAALMQKVAVKRTEKVNTDIKALTADLVDSDATGIVAWNAHVQSQLPASLANWSGFNSAIESAEEYTVPNTLPLSRSNSEGLLSLRPLSPTPYVSGLVNAEQVEGFSATSSCSVSSSTFDSSIHAEVSMIENSYFTSHLSDEKACEEISPFTVSPCSYNSHPNSTLVTQEPWSNFRTHHLALVSSPDPQINPNISSPNMFLINPQQSLHIKSQQQSNSLSMAFNPSF